MSAFLDHLAEQQQCGLDQSRGLPPRALQLVVRNVGGGRPGEVDRATLTSLEIELVY